MEKAHSSRIIAIVSGKGGSGKTMVAALMAQIMGRSVSVTLVDADTGTGGLTYYLGLNAVSNVAVGLADLLLDSSFPDTLPVQTVAWERSQVSFLGIGDHRRLYRESTSGSSRLPTIMGRLRDLNNVVIVDCRGGIDSESL